jgi:hypothetical protein
MGNDFKCKHCGYDKFDVGNMFGRDGVTYKTGKDRGTFWQDRIQVSCYVCLNCGYTQFFTDVNKLNERLARG